jgi:thiol-disulfide isomerase/thioredoxin
MGAKQKSSKQNKKLRSRASSDASMAMIFIGAGLILLGVVSLLLLNRPSTPAATFEPSTVPARVEFAAPSLTLKDLQQVEHSLNEYRGQVVLINLWATWCPPCKAEMPTLDAYYQAHRKNGFTLIAINAGETAEAVKAFVQERKLSLNVWLDPQNQASRAFQVMSYPSSFVIDRQGTVRLAWVGAISREMLEKYVTPLIGE